MKIVLRFNYGDFSYENCTSF